MIRSSGSLEDEGCSICGRGSGRQRQEVCQSWTNNDWPGSSSSSSTSSFLFSIIIVVIVIHISYVATLKNQQDPWTNLAQSLPKIANTLKTLFAKGWLSGEARDERMYKNDNKYDDLVDLVMEDPKDDDDVGCVSGKKQVG